MEKRLAVLLACFRDPKAAGLARHTLGGGLGPHDEEFLDTVVFKVTGKHKASVHDPRRVLVGTLTPALTWGLFGLVANGWVGLLIWGALGALCGGPYTYYTLHHASKSELKQVGKALPAGSSALLSFVETDDPGRLLAGVAGQSPTVAGVATIADDLSLEVAPEPPERTGAALASMVVVRYPDPDEAAKAAARLADDKKLAADNQIELVIKTDANGRRHVADPKFGVAAKTKSDIVSWGAFGVLVGAIAGATGGGILEGGLVTGVAWGIFGAFAGALYGLWVGRSVSAQRLKGVGKLLAPGTSAVLAWTDGPASARALDTLAPAGSRRLVLNFTPVEGGAVLDSAGVPPA